jgi:predicted transcriptional regulator
MRTPGIAEAKYEDIQRLRKEGLTYSSISALVYLSTPTVTKYAKMSPSKFKKLVKKTKSSIAPKKTLATNAATGQERKQELVCAVEKCDRPAFSKVNGEHLCGVHTPAIPVVDMTNKGKKAKQERLGQIVPALSSKPMNQLTKEELEEAQKAYEARQEKIQDHARGDEELISGVEVPIAIGHVDEKTKTITFVKYDAGKPKFFRYLPLFEGFFSVMNYGANKYTEDGWAEGMPDVSRYADAFFRHIRSMASGEWLDPESGLPHIDHAGANLGIIRGLLVGGFCNNDLNFATPSSEHKKSP